MGTWLGNGVGVLIALAALAPFVGPERRLSAAYRAVNSLKTPVRPVEDRLDLYELAYLCGREERLAATVLVRMHAEGRAAVERRTPYRITAALSGEPRDGVEAAVRDAWEQQTDGDDGARWPLTVSRTASPVRAVRERLVLDGLLRDENAPLGVFADHPVVRAYYEARYRFARTVRWSPAFALAGIAVAVLCHAYLPLLAYPPLLLALRLQPQRYELARRSYGEVTPAGRTAISAVSADEPCGPFTADGEGVGDGPLEPGRTEPTRAPRVVREVARSGLDALPPGHVLGPPPAPPVRSRETRPEPPEIIVDASPGLGGL